MDSLIKDIASGFAILAVVCAINGCTADMIRWAGKAQKQGIMSYKAYTELLTK